jgi:4-hydroxy-tetrahydrodipicolinate synthase
VNGIEKRFQGALIPAVPVPLRDGRDLDLAGAERLAAYIARADAAGVAVWAHTGRGLLLEEEAAVETLRAWRAALPGRIIIAGAGCRGGSTLPSGPRGDAALAAGARRMASLAARDGADAVLAHPPSRFRDLDPGGRLEAIVEYHREIAAEGLPTLAFYLFDSAGGVRYTIEELRGILGIPGVVGIKVATLDSVMTYQDIADFLAHELPEKALLTGEDRFLGYSLLRGACGALIGMGGVCPAFQKQLVEVAQTARGGCEKSAARWVALSTRADRLAECLFIEPMDGYIGRVLHGLATLGVIPAASARDPWGPALPRGELERVEEVVRELEES